MRNLYLITYKDTNENVISQFLVTAKTKEGGMERIEQKYNFHYYMLNHKLVCQTQKDVLIQTI